MNFSDKEKRDDYLNDKQHRDYSLYNLFIGK
jgi:hypothetical protein